MGQDLTAARRAGGLVVVLALALVALDGCKKDEQAPAAGSPGAPQPGTSAPAAPLTPAQLTPVIRELGADGVLPTELVLEFPRPIAQKGQVPEGTRVRVEPDHPGALALRGPSTLVFVPARPFAHDTQYTVRLEALGNDGRTLRPPDAKAWAYTFTTPPLRFLRLAPLELDAQRGRAVLDLVFSGPVDLATVRRLTAWSVDGQPFADVKLGSGAQRNVLRAQLTGARIRPGASVRFALREGLAPGVPAAEDTVRLTAARRMEIRNAYLEEGPSGPYVEVICREVDPADPRGRTDVQAEEGEDGEEAAGPCALDESGAGDAIRFDPPARLSLSATRNGFRVFGDLKRGTYTLYVDAGVTSSSGAVLLAPFERAFSVPARRPQLSFGAAGRYLPRSAWRALPLNHLNVDRVEVVARHVPPENLVFWMSNDDSERADERTSNVIARRTVGVSGPADTQATTSIDVASLVPANTRGLVELRATSDEAEAATRVLLTDLSLVAKRSGAGTDLKSAHEVRVWALGIESAEPLSGVEVTLIKKSGQQVARCTTGGADGCTLPVLAVGVDDALPFALVARKGDDLTYLKYSELRADVSESDVQGVPYRAEAAYRGALYTDRGVYRPGDTAHVVAVLRGENDQAPPAGMPVELRVVDPRERDLKRVQLETNEAGVVALDVPFQAFQDTGRYTLRVSVAERLVTQGALNVEEFVPERMKVAAQAQGEAFAQGDEVPVAVDAQYLFGGSAAGAQVELACRLEPGAFKPRENAQYTYGVWRHDPVKVKPHVLGQVRATLDEQGRARVSCPASRAAGGFKGPARLVAQASVFEAGSGRASVGEAAAPVHPEAWYVGLLAGGQKAQAGKAFTVQGVVVDWQGRLVADAGKHAPLQVEYYRLEEEYGWYYEEGEGEHVQRTLRPVREGRASVLPQGGRFTLTVTPQQDAGGYLVRVKSGRAQTDLQLEGQGWSYAWEGPGGRVDQTPRPLKPTRLALEAPRVAKVGDGVEVRLKAPYRGQLLFTAEADHVLAAEWVKAEAGEVRWRFTPREFTPNVYVSAFLVKDPHLESAEAFLPDRAFGVTSVALEPTAYTQALALRVPKEVRSRDTLKVELDLGKPEGPTYATVAVVDEGILQLTRFRSPNPLEQLFAKRALGVDTFETVGWTLLVPPAGAQRATGGDEGEGAGGRVQPVKPVALWSGLVRVPDSGKATLSLPLPAYRGQVRVMAVTVGPRRVGSASAQVTVRDPLVLQATLPRFLTLDDEVQIPVQVTNLSGRAQDVRVTLQAENLAVPGLATPAGTGAPLALLGKPEGRVRLDNGKGATLVFRARATQAYGAVRLKALAQAPGLTSDESLDVPLLPAGPRERRVERIELAQGVTDLLPYLQGWVPTSERSTFWVTTNPYARSLEHLRYLVQYPYGCVEQTTSSTRPLLYVSQLLDSVDPTLTRGAPVEALVQAGLDRVLSMQTPSGGFGYWPGDTEPVAWGSAYATHLLLDAQKVGYPVPQDRLDDALRYLAAEAGRTEARARERRWGEDSEPYLHYVLAAAGKGHKARVQKLLADLPARPRSGQEAEHAFMLKAALWLAGDRRYEQDLKHPDVSPVTDERKNGWSFYSDRRRRGFMLSTFQDLFGNDPAGEPLAHRVAEALQGPSGGYTTQELVWGVTGLGKRVAGHTARFSPPTLAVDGKAVAAQQDAAARGSDRTWSLARASERKGLRLEVKEKSEGALYLVLASEGVRAGGGWRTGGEGLRLRRTYRTLDGAELDVRGRAVPLAELVYVDVEVENTTGERLQNIALVDRLPAGWEIENARLGRGGAVAWAGQDTLWQPDYVNVRDDRLEAFGSLEAGEKKRVVYAVRATGAGVFSLPPVEAGAMYEPRVWAREGGGKVEVSGPWKDELL